MRTVVPEIRDKIQRWHEVVCIINDTLVLNYHYSNPEIALLETTTPSHVMACIKAALSRHAYLLCWQQIVNHNSLLGARVSVATRLMTLSLLWSWKTLSNG